MERIPPQKKMQSKRKGTRPQSLQKAYMEEAMAELPAEPPVEPPQAVLPLQPNVERHTPPSTKATPTRWKSQIKRIKRTLARL